MKYGTVEVPDSDFKPENVVYTPRVTKYDKAEEYANTFGHGTTDKIRRCNAYVAGYEEGIRYAVTEFFEALGTPVELKKK